MRSRDRNNLPPVPRFILPGAPKINDLGQESHVLGCPARPLRDDLSTGKTIQPLATRRMVKTCERSNTRFAIAIRRLMSGLA
jgi:hypothetical protein